MKILTFTSLFPNSIFPNHGIFICHRIVALQKLGYDIRVVAPVPYFPHWPFLKIFARWHTYSTIPQKEEIYGLETYHPRYFNPPKIGMAYYGNWMYRGVIQNIESIYKEFPFDVVDAHYLYPDGLAGVLVAQKFHVPIIISARGTDAHLFTHIPKLQHHIQYVLEHANHIISVSENLTADMKQVVPTIVDKLSIIPNGIDSSIFCYETMATARARLGLSMQEKIIVSVSSLTPRKNLSVLIHAMRFLKNNEKLYIIGKGEMANTLHQQIMHHHLQERVFLLGAKLQQDLPDWYRSADLMCLSSQNEGSPNVVYEAQGCGTPVVAFELDGIKQVIDMSNKGKLVEMKYLASPEELAKTLQLALVEKYDRFQIAEYAKQRTWNSVAKDVQKILEQL